MEIDSVRNTAASPGWLPSISRLVGVGLALVCLDIAALILNRNSWSTGGVTILWPPNGLLLGVMLCVPRRQWPAYLTVGYLTDLGINLALSWHFLPHLWLSAYLAGCNMLEVSVAAIFLYRTIAPNPDLTQRRQLMSLLLYGVVLAPAVASLCAQATSARTP